MFAEVQQCLPRLGYVCRGTKHCRTTEILAEVATCLSRCRVACRRTELRAEVQGRVITVDNNFIDGGIVAKGDQLVSFDSFDYASQVSEKEAELIEAKARSLELQAEYDGATALLKRDKEQAKLRKRDVARRARLIRRKNVSEKTFDDAKLADPLISEQYLADGLMETNSWLSRLLSRLVPLKA